MILTKEFKEGKITVENIKDKKNLDKLKNNYLLFEMDNKNKPYEVLFYEKYNKKYSLNYIFVNEIFNFILTGLINHVQLEKEITQLFETIESKEKLALEKLSNTRENEEYDLKNACENVIEYLKNGNYSLLELQDIYTLLKYHEQKGYISDWNYNVEEIINEAFDKSVKNPANIPNSTDFRYFHIFDESQTKNEFYKELSKKVKKKSSEKEHQKNENKINNIFDLAKQNSEEAHLKLRDYQHSKLFTDIVESKLMYRFFDLKNFGLYCFESFLQCDILQNINAGEYGYSQKKDIDIISKYLRENIENKKLEGMRKKRFLEFVALLDEAGKHLENTK